MEITRSVLFWILWLTDEILVGRRPAEAFAAAAFLPQQQQQPIFQLGMKSAFHKKHSQNNEIQHHPRSNGLTYVCTQTSRSAISMNFSGNHETRTVTQKRQEQEQQQEQEQYPISSQGSNNSEISTIDSLQEVLRKSQEKSLDMFIENEAPPWLRNMHQSQQTQQQDQSSSTTLPFSCTGCGKCCRTVGDVYMAPEDIFAAAKTLKLTPTMFVEKYAASYMVSDPELNTAIQDSKGFDQLLNDEKIWIRLKEGPATDDTEGSGDESDSASCIFLDRTTNQCGIYEARPVQCRTYPFWPSILASPGTWNAECRRPDDDVEKVKTGAGCTNDMNGYEGDNDAPLPLWTAEDGGCEGMQKIRFDDSHGRGEKLLVEPYTMDESAVPVREACRNLFEYLSSDSRFPNPAIETLLDSN